MIQKAERIDVLSSWHHLVEDFSASSQEFYSLLEKAIVRRQIPNLEISRVEWKEGGLLSANREYLRLSRERLICYVCAAPFGTGFFFSSKLGEISSRLTPKQMLVLLVILALFFKGFISALGNFWGPVVLIGIIVSLVLFARSIARKGLTNFDAIILKIPLIGSIYYTLFRPITYFRYDAINSYASAVHTAVLEVIDEVTKAKGIRLSESERKPNVKFPWR